ncbi:MAG: TonB-dependent receptor [Polaribacter sp.]|nr:TonB-dependent receptor [Polaribacter sp.]
MKTKIKTLPILIALLITTAICTQTIKGKVTDVVDVIPFVNVILKGINNKIIAGTTTTDEGKFELKTSNGTFTIEISFLGYQTLSRTIIVNKNINLGTLVLKENLQALEEIVVKLEKRVLERKVDRLVFNVKKNIAATGGNGLDVLRITPGVQLQNNTISILGKGASQVLVNGRLSPLAGDELIAFLSAFSANDIVKIEVITNPPAKYDAAGNGGLINIILKKGLQNSWKNSTTLSYNQNKYSFTTLTNNFLYNKNKISFSGSLNATKGDEGNLSGLQISYPNNFWDIDIEGKGQRDQFSGRFLIDYAISDKTTFGLQYLRNTTQPNIVAETMFAVFDTNNNLERSLLTTGNNINDNKNHSVNFHLLTQLDSLGRSISFDADYFTFSADRTNDFFTESFNTSGVSQGLISAALNEANQEIENFSAKIDLEYPLKKVNLSYGVKASFTNTISNVLFFDILSGSPVLDLNQSNDFTYKENVLAAYFSGNSNLTDKLEMQFGLRFEDTKTTGFNVDLNQENVNNYNKFFPSLYFSYAKNEDNNFNFSYGKRINRPNFRNLNPFRFYINDNSYSEGNPFLQPSFADTFKFSHLYKNNISSSLSFDIITNGFGVFFNTDVVNQNQIVTQENYFKKYIYKWEESFSYNNISWFKSQNSINVLAYFTELTKNNNAEVNDGVQFYAESYNTFILSKSTKLQINAWYSSFHNDGLFSVGEMFHLSFGVEHDFKNNIKLSVLLSDVLNMGSLNNYDSTVNNINQSYSENQSSRNFRISLSYDFWNKKIKGNNRGFGNEDEQRRSN